MAQTLITSPDTNCGKSVLSDQSDSIRCKQDSPISTVFSAPDTDVSCKESLEHDDTVPNTGHGRKHSERDQEFIFSVSPSPNSDGPISSGDVAPPNIMSECHRMSSRSPSPDNKVQSTPSAVVTSPVQSAASVTTSVKRPRHKPGERRELLIQAVQDVLTLHISMRRAAQKHNLAKSSLCDFVRKNGIVLPNLRLKTYQNAQHPPGTDDGSKKGNLSSFNYANRPTSSTCKRGAVSLSEGLNQLNDKQSSLNPLPPKLSCNINRKPGANRQKPSSRASSRSGSRVSESPMGNDTLMTTIGSENSADLISHNSVRYDGLDHHTGSTPCFGDTTLSVSRLMHPSTGLSNPKYSLSSCVLPKTARIESPWHNAAGLPTQVPMRSWSALGCSQQNSLNNSLSNNCPNSDNSDGRSQAENAQSLLMNSHSMDGSMLNTHENSISGHNQTFPGADLMEPTDLSCDPNSAVNGTNNSEPYFGSANHISCLNDSNDHVLSSSNQNGSPNSQTSLDFDRRHNFTEDNIHNSLISNHLTNGFNGTLDPENLVLSRPSSTSHSYPVDSSFTTPYNNYSSREKILSTSSGNLNFDQISRKFNPSSNTSSATTPGTVNNRSSTRPVRIPKVSDLPRSNLASDLIATAERLASGPGTSALYSFFGLNPTAALNPSCCSSPSQPLFPSNFVNPLAALLLQHSRNLQSDPTAANLSSVFGYPSQLGYTVNPTLLTHPPSLFSSNIAESSQPNSTSNTTIDTTTAGNTTNCIPKFPSTLNNTITNSTSTNACTSSQLSISESNSVSSDFFNHFNLGDAQNLLKQPTKLTTELTSNCSPSSSSSSSSFSSSNLNTGIDLLPYLSSQSAAQSLRHFAKDLFLGSLTLKNSHLLESNNSSTNQCLNSSKPNTTHLQSSVLNTTTIQANRNPVNINLSNHQPEDSPTMSAHVQGLINFINRSPSPFHAIHTARAILTAHGFRELRDEDVWNIRPMDRVFVTKNESTVLAAAIGGKFELGGGFSLLGAHTDSPCLRLKPNSERIKENYVQLGVETYGGGLWYTWFDRDLTVAGRVIVRNSKGKLEQRLVHIERPLACVPSLAIHLNQEVKTQGFQPNHEQHLCPILCTSIIEQLSYPENSMQTSTGPTFTNSPNAQINHNPTNLSTKHRHPTALMRLLSQELGVPDHDILELELCLVDSQPARVGGVFNEFIHAPRLDNLFNSYAGLHGLVESLPSLDNDPNIRLVCLYDHEEVGSTSTQGANSTYTMTTMRRIVTALQRSLGTGSDLSDLHFEQSLARSFLISADQAHAVHPSWNERHEMGHRPQLHGGLVLKYNAFQRYATNGLTAALVREVAHLSNVPLQEFVARQDMGCGSTIGPMLSSQLGVPTVDVGFAQLAMHSCRELCCSTSVSQAVRFYTSYFDHLPHIWSNLNSINSTSEPMSQSDGARS